MNASSAPSRPLTHRETLWIVFGVLIPVLMASLDQAMLTAALPSIGRELGEAQNLSWIVAAYLLTMTAATPLYGKFADIKGRPITLTVAIVIFMTGAIAAALAPNMMTLILARAIQGIGSGGLISMSMTVLGDVATPKERARYYTYFSVVYTSSGAIGPALGGFFAEYLNWRFVFWVTVPLGILALICVATLLRKLPRHERPRKMDLPGAFLIVAASSTFMFVLTAGGKTWAWASWQIATLLGVSVMFWCMFFWRLTHAPEPLIPLGMLRNQIVRTSTIANASGWGAIIAMNVYLPLYLQVIHGMSPAQSGLYLMVVMVTINSAALVGAQVAARVEHYKRFPLITLAISILALLYMAWRVEAMSPLEFEIVLAIMGVGFGPIAPVTTVATQNAVKLNEMGTATSVMSFTRSLFGSILVAALGAIVLHTVSGAGLAGALGADRAAAVEAFRWLFIVTAGAVTIAFVSFWMMEEKPLLSSNEGRM